MLLLHRMTGSLMSLPKILSVALAIRPPAMRYVKSRRLEAEILVIRHQLNVLNA
jgi:hypothetical protein